MNLDQPGKSRPMALATSISETKSDFVSGCRTSDFPLRVNDVALGIAQDEKGNAHGIDVSDLRIGDIVTVRHKITHTGIPGAVAGVKIGQAVIGFVADDIVGVEPRPLVRGDNVVFKSPWGGRGLKHNVRHVEDGYATIVMAGERGIPQCIQIERLRRVD